MHVSVGIESLISLLLSVTYALFLSVPGVPKSFAELTAKNKWSEFLSHETGMPVIERTMLCLCNVVCRYDGDGKDRGCQRDWRWVRSGASLSRARCRLDEARSLKIKKKE